MQEKSDAPSTNNTCPACIEDLMRPPVIIPIGTTLKECLERMVKEKRNSLTVVNQDGTFAGAVNAVDVIREVLPDYLEEDVIAVRFADDALLAQDAQRVADHPVESFMARDVPTVTLESSLVEAAVLASVKGRGRITVLDDHRHPIGVLTRTEIKRVIAFYLGIPGALD